jgi:chaperonin GroEL (HSP60 family)
LGPQSDFFAALAVKAVTSIKTVNSEGKARYPITAIHILKCHGKSATESELVDGFALNAVSELSSSFFVKMVYAMYDDDDDDVVHALFQ